MKISNNLYFVCLNDEFGKEVCEILAKILVLPFVDCEAFISKDLLERKVSKENADLEYLNLQEKLALFECLLQSGVFLLNFDIFKHNIDLFQDKSVRYLALPKKEVSNKINQISFSSRNKFLSQNCITIHLNSTSQQEMEKIFKSLGV